MASRPGGVVDRPLDPGGKIVISARSVFVVNLHSDDFSCPCDTACSAGYSASHVRSVAIGIGILVRPPLGECRSVAGTATKLRVCDPDAGVDNVHHNLMGLVGVVDIFIAGSGPVGNGTKTPAFGVGLYSLWTQTSAKARQEEGEKTEDDLPNPS